MKLLPQYTNSTIANVIVEIGYTAMLIQATIDNIKRKDNVIECAINQIVINKEMKESIQRINTYLV